MSFVRIAEPMLFVHHRDQTRMKKRDLIRQKQKRELLTDLRVCKVVFNRVEYVNFRIDVSLFLNALNFGLFLC